MKQECKRIHKPVCFQCLGTGRVVYIGGKGVGPACSWCNPPQRYKYDVFLPHTVQLPV